MQEAFLATQLAAAQAASVSAAATSTASLMQQSAPVQPRGQLRIDQLFSTVPNRSTLSGSSQNNLKPKEEPRNLWIFVKQIIVLLELKLRP